ncbi:hypothetical protein WOLCODRAFT_140399 [Wolfiporia cocos MD-104 SS10]|uniref:FAD binding domain-containing protein n=1 Tax=Wolfiporia cocos (strain MD-104) TaxID=742152 RepID=A0A2H3JI95_WOLCO|nr:hypothetical protein WOLCODRAFT_140399 [Wolfiporia cocos MD-104 SS10]
MRWRNTSGESDCDVLIIGAGPAGLVCANALANFGVNIRIVDQRPVKVAAGQADGIRPRTIEVFQSYGLAERLLREGTLVNRTAFYNPGPNGGIERTGRIPDVIAPTARYPFEVTLHQGGIEAIFLDSMAALGVHVERPIVPTSIELTTVETELKDPNSHAVKVVLKHLDAAATEDATETEIVHAKFVLGADGAHSWVRKSLGIAMEGDQTDYIWGALDFIPDTDLPDIRNFCVVHSHSGSCVVIPREGDTVRLYIQLSDADVQDAATGRVDKSKFSPERLLDIARRSLSPFTIAAPRGVEWWTLYIIGQRVASKYSVQERVFIAGDACHTHSPKGGQGMNASINDSHGLAWKLTHVIRGWAGLSLLKTYEFERRKYAQDLIAFDKRFAALVSDKPRTDEDADGVTHEELLEATQIFGPFMNGIGVYYAPSVLTRMTHQASVRGLVIGQCLHPHIFVRAADALPVDIHDMLPADGRFGVAVFAGDADTHLAALARELDALLRRHADQRGGVAAVFNVFTVLARSKDDVDYTDVPELLRPHWSRVLLDDTDMFGRSGGGGYDAYGIDRTRGAVVIVRPDGFVGTVAPLEHLSEIDDYFSSFMVGPGQ